MSTTNKIAFGIIIAIAAFSFYSWRHADTLENRQRVADHLNDLKQQVVRGPNSTEALHEIIVILNGKWSFARTYALGVLSDLGPQAKSAVPDIINALTCGDAVVEREAARTLGEVAVGMPKAVEPLRSMLRYDDRDIGWFSVESLGNVGLPAVVCIPDLELAATSRYESMRWYAQAALVKLKALRDREKAIHGAVQQNGDDEAIKVK